MKPFAPVFATLLTAASSPAWAHELVSLPHVHPHPDWTLSLMAVAVIAGVAGVALLARRAAAKARNRRS